MTTFTPTLRILQVGGCVRDDLLGVRSNDIDCTVIVNDPLPGMTVEQAFEIMRAHLTREGFRIYVETPEHATIRAQSPAGMGSGKLDADFVLARREGPYSDGRRPDWVEVGTLEDDLARRDFSVNAMARDLVTGDLVDLHGGLDDLSNRVIRFVGDPRQRIVEDALRVMRGVRFVTTMPGFGWHPDSRAALEHPDVPDLLAGISEERRETELSKMFSKCSTPRVLDVLGALPTRLREAMFAGRVRLTSTLRK